MVLGERSDYNDPEHEKKLRALGEGGLTRPPGCQKPSKMRPPPPYVHDEKGSEITAGDWVRIEDEVYKVRAVDVSAKTVDIGCRDWEPATNCVGVVRSIDELAEDGVIPEGARLGGSLWHYYKRKFYHRRQPLATHPDYRFSSVVVRRLKASVREAQNKQSRESRARRKDKDESDGDTAQMFYRKGARGHAKRVAAILRTCPCNSGLDVQWCDKCDRPGSGASRRHFGVAAPLFGATSNDSFEELTGMSREDFARYEKACMHPAPAELVQELCNARRILGDTPVRSVEYEHVYPKSAYERAVRQMIGFAADGKTPNDAAKGAFRFCELQLMLWTDNKKKGRGFSGDLPRLYRERLLCCMSRASLALYEDNRLDPRVKFFKIDTIVKKLEAWGEARAKELGSSVFVPAGAKKGWEVCAVDTMAADARAVKAWRRRRGEAVDDEDDEEEAAVDERDREAAARERATRCVEIKLKAPDAMEDNTFLHRRSGARQTARRARRRSAWRSCATGPSAARGACCRRRRRGGRGGFASTRPSAPFTGRGSSTSRRRSSRCAPSAAATW